MSIDIPDWLRGTLLLGRDGDGNIIPILIDAAGQLNILVRGVDGTGTVRTVKVDSSGQLYAILRGAGGNDVAVDAAGNLAAVLKGLGADAALHTIAVDNAGQTIMVPRGQSGNYMSVDANGFLTAVLKGAYGATLTTIGVDANGRIEAFLLENVSQWGDVLRVGNAEQAARLGSLKNWDWRGAVYYQNDFSKGTGNILKYNNGTGSAVALNTQYWVNGGYSLKLTGGSDNAGDAYIDTWLDHPPSTKLGLEALVSGTTAFEYLWIKLIVYTGGKIYHAGLKIESAVPPNIKYLNSSGVWTQLGTTYYGVSIEMFNHIKIVADFSTFKYLRAMCGDTEYDLSAQSLYQPATGYLNQLCAEIYLKSRSTYNDIKYIDYMICTVDEPA